MPIIPVSGGEWAMPSVGASPSASPTSAPSGGSFSGALSKAVSSLQAGQTDAAAQSQALATGQASDPEAVVMAVEQARLEMELASQIRTKVTDSINTLMQTQV